MPAHRGQSPEFLRKVRRKFKLGEFRPRRVQRATAGPPARRAAVGARRRLNRSRKPVKPYKAEQFGFGY